MSESYQFKKVLITGGSSGIGLALAKALAAEGAHLFIIARKNSLLDSIAIDLETRHRDCEVDLIPCDISDTDQIRDTAAVIRSKTTVVDLLINNAGYATYELFEELTYEEMVKLATTNFNGHIAMTFALMDLVRSAKSGHICFINSIAAEIPITPNLVYGASKRGLDGFANLLRHELRVHGINVTSVFPGRAVTPFFDGPTFRNRTGGIERKLTTPVTVVSEKIIAGLKKRKKKIYVPQYWRAISYLYRSDPLFSGKIFDVILAARLKRCRQHLKESEN